MHEVPYDPFEQNAIPTLFIYPIVIVILSVIVFYTLKQYFAKRSKIALYLSLGLLSYDLAAAVLLVGILEAYIDGYFGSVYRFSLPIGYIGGVLGTFFMLYFAKETFWKFGGKIETLYIAGTIILILWLLYDPIFADILRISDPFNWWGRTAPEDVYNFRAVTQFVLLAYSIAVYTVILIHSRKAAKTASDAIFAKKLNSIATGALGMILFYFFMFIDGIVIILTGRGYSIFVYLAWVVGVYSLYSYYRGFAPRKK